MLEVEKASHDCRVGAQTFEALQSPATVEGQRASALRFGDARVQCLFAVLLLLCLQLEGFRNRQLRPLLAQMLGLEESNISAGRVSYELRRLRLHGLIERIEGTHRYRLTPEGLGHGGLLSTHLCQNHPPGPLRYPQHLLPPGPANGSRLQ